MSAEAAIHAARSRGELRTAHRLATRWLGLEPDHPRARQLWAQLSLELNLARSEAERLQLTAEAHPDDPRPVLGMAQEAYQRGAVPAARGALNRVLQRFSTPEALSTGAALAEAAGDTEALSALLTAWARAAPTDPAPLAHAARIHKAAGKAPEAAALLAQAAARAPQDADLWLRLGHERAHLGDAPGALEALKAARAAAPTLAEAHVQAGRSALFLSENTFADDAFSMADRLEPGRPDALWGLAAALAPVARDSAHEATLVRDYAHRLAAVEALSAPDTPATAERWRVATQSAFVRHYHGGDCLPEQRRVGRLLQRAVSGVASALPAPRPARGARIRVAFVTSYLYRHTISKLFAGWLRHLDRSRFAVVALSCSHRHDAFTDAIRAHTPVHILPGGLLDAARAIREHDPEVVIFPELGMDPFVLQLGALRHAPVQAVAWGHPVTTGLPTIDAFLSSAAMGVAPDRTWTTEERVDLPGLSICYDRPQPAPGAFSLPLPDAPLALCVQNLRKYRPFTDDLHVALAQRAPEARLVFVSHHRPAITAAYQQRLGAAFARAGLSLANHAVFLPRLSQQQWMQLMAAGTLFLDGPGWSGGNTALEAFAVGTPCLAFPGETFRGRHTLGMVRELGLPALEAHDASDFVDKAVALLTQPRALAPVREAVQERAGRLYGDTRGVRALEQWMMARCAQGST